MVKYKASGVGQYLNMSKLKREMNSDRSAVLSEETQSKLAAKKLKLQQGSSVFGKGFKAW